MTTLAATEGPWIWVAKPNGAVVLATVDGLNVMDCVRKGTQACAPRFATWTGIAEGLPRAGRAGVMSMSHSWFNAAGALAHPDALVIAAAPDLLKALQFAVRFFDQLTPADALRMSLALAKAGAAS